MDNRHPRGAGQAQARWEGVRLACDIGGTFTDLALWDPASGRLVVHKVPSTPSDFADGVLMGVEALLAKAGLGPDSVGAVLHSTTVGINTLVERTGPRTGLVTTRGFRDVLEIGRASRAHEYDLFQVRPPPLVRRRWRVEVAERVLADGTVEVPLDEAEVRQAARFFRDEGVEAVAVAFLHAYRYPAHERRAAAILFEALPGATVVCSADVVPVYREYERTVAVVLEAYLAPRVRGYLERLEARLERLGARCPLYVTQGSGGLMTAAAARARTIQTLMAGPAAGVTAAAFVAGLTGDSRVISLDIGGTTQLVSVVEAGRPSVVLDGTVLGFPIRVPTVDVRPIGAGGGSIARVGAAGMLRVGPDSAGADPGPACYGRGGTEPTVTDADLVLGYLDPAAFLGGAMRLDRTLAERAILERIARPLGLDLYRAAAGVVEVVNAQRAGALRQLVVEAGRDPRDYTLVAFGGAGPVHAGALMDELGFPRLVVPPYSGVASALGALASDFRREYVRTLGDRVDAWSAADLTGALQELVDWARRDLGEEGFTAGTMEVSADLKYAGQLAELTVRLPDGAAGLSPLALREGFLAEHRRLYGFAVDDEAVVLTNLRLTAVVALPPPQLPRLAPGPESPAAAQKGSRPVFFPGAERPSPCPVYDRGRLLAGARIPGPAIVEQPDSTVVVRPSQVARVDPVGNLVITREGGGCGAH